MADFTIELSEVIETIFNDSTDQLEWEQEYHSVTFAGVTYGRLPIVPDWNEIGLGTYPIFDPAYRDILNGKIVDEFFKREIGVETIDMFKLVMRRKMDQIMPYWNKIYESELIDYTALQTMDIHSVTVGIEEENGQVNAEVVTENKTNSKSRAVSSQMPQTMLAGNADYASSATDTNSDSEVDSESNQESTSSNSTESNRDNRVTGFQGVSSDLVARYRATLLNIDAQILREIEDCFMGILTTGDAYTRQGWYAF